MSSTVADDELLMNLGYKPELKRNFSPLQVFGIAFSIMSLVPSIASVLGLAAAGGGVGITWGWFVPCFFIMSVGLSLAEMGSAMPTSGGLYWWTYKFAPQRYKRVACFLCGYANTLGLIGGLCSIDYGFAQMVLSVPVIASDGNFVSSKYQCYGIFVFAVVTQACAGMIPSKLISRLQTLCIVLNMILIFLICIALPIGITRGARSINSGKFVFGDTTNLSDWPYGWQFMMSWMAAIWTIGAFDSCIHMSEEASNASVAVPLGIVMSIGACWILGFIVQCVIAACISPDVAAVVNTSTGNVMAQVILDGLGKKWAIALMSLMFAVQWLMGLSVLVAASRQTWAFSRDGALPFSSWVRKINLKYGVPVRAVVFDAVISVLIGLLVLIDATAANALFSLYSSSNSFSWMLPIFFRLLNYNKEDYTPGPFFLGHTISRINNFISVIYLTFVVFVLTMFPADRAVTAQTMNYTCVINPTVWIGALAYYFLDAHKWFQGPAHTIDVYSGEEPGIDKNIVRLPSKEESHEPSDSVETGKNVAVIDEKSY